MGISTNQLFFFAGYLRLAMFTVRVCGSVARNPWAEFWIRTATGAFPKAVIGTRLGRGEKAVRVRVSSGGFRVGET